MREFLQQLIHRQHAVISGDRTDSDQHNTERENLTSLVLADAALCKADAGFAKHPLQVAVIGPTQVGKSSVANMLIGQSVACLLYTSPSPRDATLSRMPSSA